MNILTFINVEYLRQRKVSIFYKRLKMFFLKKNHTNEVILPCVYIIFFLTYLTLIRLINSNKIGWLRLRFSKLAQIFVYSVYNLFSNYFLNLLFIFLASISFHHWVRWITFDGTGNRTSHRNFKHLSCSVDFFKKSALFIYNVFI